MRGATATVGIEGYRKVGGEKSKVSPPEEERPAVPPEKGQGRNSGPSVLT